MPRKGATFSIIRPVVIAGATVAIGIVVCSLMFAERIIFQPPEPSYSDAGEVVKIVKANGIKISATYLPNESAEFTILYSHGNAEDLGSVRYKLEELRDMGFSVLGYDYEGYGTSGGSPSEEAVYGDIEAAYNFLREKGVSADRIILHGWSLGGAVAVDLARRQPIAGLILESTFVSAYRVITRYPILPFDRFRTLSKLKDVNCPVLVIHGTDDEVINLWHGKLIFESANEPKHSRWIDGGRHGDLSLHDRDAYRRSLMDFANTAVASGN